MFLLHHLSDAAVDASFDPQSGFGRFLRNVTGLGERAIERLGLLFRTVFDIVLVLAGLPLLFALWTVTWIDMRSMLTSATIGFNVGDINISPRLILVILVTFALGILLTKLVISWLDRRILSNTRINRGVQDSLRTGATYAGYILAAVFALSAAGLDFSNLALVAGALGVGIGLGLQSIVNNFVSGLILLAERPIRVGDWVALPAGEGIVKRINVRSTEIETFDSCSIIVPNSSLITEPVRNWTHGSNRGRFIVAVTVDQESDPEEVRDLLTEIARANDKILTLPGTQCSIGRDSDLWASTSSSRPSYPTSSDGAVVASDVRFEILRTFPRKRDYHSQSGWAISGAAAVGGRHEREEADGGRPVGSRVSPGDAQGLAWLGHGRDLNFRLVAVDDGSATFEALPGPQFYNPAAPHAWRLLRDADRQRNGRARCRQNCPRGRVTAPSR